MRELFQNQASGLRPIGFIDDDVSKQDRVVSGLPVLGIGRDLDQILCSTEAEGILIATDKISTDRIERATEVCRRAGVQSLPARRHGSAPGRREASPEPGEMAPALSIPEAFEMEPQVMSFDIAATFGSQPCPSCKTAHVPFRPEALRARPKVVDPPAALSLRSMRVAGLAHALAFNGAALVEDLSSSPDLGTLDTALPAGALVGAGFSASDLK